MKLNNLESRIKLPDGFVKELNIDSELDYANVSYNENIQYPPIILEYKEDNKFIRIATYGNFSALVGKQKSRKTFLVSLLMAACVKNGLVQRFKGHTHNCINMFFDTEQARYDVERVNNRVLNLIGQKSQTDNFRCFSLRKYNPEERVQIIEYALTKCKNPGYIVIDGVRDLVTDINDPDQATEITTKLMQWTEENNCHICVGLHLNKGQNAELRGHLGTEIQNKAESVIEVEKIKEKPEFSLVKARDFRGEIFEDFVFSIDGNYLPQICEDYTPEIEL